MLTFLIIVTNKMLLKLENVVVVMDSCSMFRHFNCCPLKILSFHYKYPLMHTIFDNDYLLRSCHCV